MPTDLAFPFAYDETGDAETVTETDFYEQHALILALESIEDVAGGPLTANEAIEITSTIEDTFARSAYFTEPISVTITDTVETELSLRVRLGSGQQFTLDVPTDV